MTVLSIDGKTFGSLPVFEFSIDTQILDGDGTGRMQAFGWPMFRDPNGVIKNISGRIGLPNNASNNSDFIDFIAAMDRFGTQDFATVTFHTPSGTISQKMYGASYRVEAKRFTDNGITYWGSIPFQFVAKEAIS